MPFSNLNVRNSNKYPEYLSAHRLCNRVRAAGAAPRVPLARRGGASDVPRDRPPPRLAPRYVIFPHALFRTIDLYRFGRKKNVETCLKKWRIWKNIHIPYTRNRISSGVTGTRANCGTDISIHTA